MAAAPLLAAVTARARVGATTQAWRLFREGGLDRIADDPAVLAVRGRLLKDEARAARDPAERHRLFRAAGEAYEAAGALEPGRTYPAINAATLAFLARDWGAARARARAVLELGDDPEETPYYQAATQAEALLLLGRKDEARAALAQAVARAPRAWEDHASTLQQFRALVGETGEDAAWLSLLRPPRCLHFAGHMALANPEKLAREVQALLEREEIGFGFGALAAGSDLVIAEALLARGAELHVVLPAEPGLFARSSVGGAWTERFNGALSAAETVRVVKEAGRAAGDDGGLRTLEIELAAEAAMGAAVMLAAQLATDAVQLLVLDGAGRIEAGVSGGAVRRLWRRAQHVVEAPRGGAVAASAPRPPNGAKLAAVLAVEGLSIEELHEGLASGPEPLVAPRLVGSGLQLAYARPEQAAKTALRLLDGFGERLRIGADYGVLTLSPGPPSRGLGLEGQAAQSAQRIAPATPPGGVQVSEIFAQALHAAGDPTPDPPLRTEYVGDLPGPDPDSALGLFALLRRAGEG